jgi:hypothetical protein
LGRSARPSCRFQRRRYSVYLLYWRKSTDTDTAKLTPAARDGCGASAAGDGAARAEGTQFTCCTGTKVQILTLLRELKEAHAKLRTTFSKLKLEKSSVDETLAATVVELQHAHSRNAELHTQVLLVYAALRYYCMRP